MIRALCVDVACNILGMPLLSAGSPAEAELRELLSEKQHSASLGMAPGIHCWWTGSPDPSPAWLKEEAAEKAAYARYVHSEKTPDIVIICCQDTHFLYTPVLIGPLNLGSCFWKSCFCISASWPQRVR